MRNQIVLVAALMVFGALAAPRALANADIGGDWAVEFSGGDIQSEADMRMYVTQADSRLTGYIDWNSSASDYPLKGTIADDRFVITWTSSVNGTVSEITFNGTVKGDELTGAVEIPGRQPAELYGRRTGR